MPKGKPPTLNQLEQENSKGRAGRREGQQELEVAIVMESIRKSR